MSHHDDDDALRSLSLFQKRRKEKASITIAFLARGEKEKEKERGELFLPPSRQEEN